MTTTSPQANASAQWEATIRDLEERSRVAFLAGDTETLSGLWADNFLVNSPLNVVNDKLGVLDLLRSGRIRHTMQELTIEYVERYGDVVVVMGRDIIDGPPTNTRTSRRYTNVWQLQDGQWKMIARHAQEVPRPPAG